MSGNQGIIDKRIFSGEDEMMIQSRLPLSKGGIPFDRFNEDLEIFNLKKKIQHYTIEVDQKPTINNTQTQLRKSQNFQKSNAAIIKNG